MNWQEHQFLHTKMVYSGNTTQTQQPESHRAIDGGHAFFSLLILFPRQHGCEERVLEAGGWSHLLLSFARSEAVHLTCILPAYISSREDEFNTGR